MELRPQLPDEDCVEFFLYPDCPSSLLEQKRLQYKEWLWTVFPFLSSYIWQRDSFDLEVANDCEVPALRGQVCFGDNLTDEWLIVFLLQELTLRFRDLVVEVYDNDGQFILIECARELPEWLEPETADRRVYLWGGELQIIPVPHEGLSDAPFAPPLNPPLTLASAVSIVRQWAPRGILLPLDGVRALLRRRLCDMPQSALLCNHHRANAIIPLPLARLFAARPSVIAKAVEYFYYRQPEQITVARNRSHFTPSKHPFVMCAVRFTRVLYAQLRQQTFLPPSIEWKMPDVSDPSFRAAETGMKLCFGFDLWRVENQQQLDELLKESESVPIREPIAHDDDEGWMLMAPQQVEDMVVGKEADAANLAREMDRAVESIHAFVEHESGMEGAEIPSSNEAGMLDMDVFVKALRSGLGLHEGANADEEEEEEDGRVIQDVMDEELRQEGIPRGEDIDYGLVKNILEQYGAVSGDGGPMMALLAELKGNK